MKKKAHPRSCHKCRFLGSEDDGNFPEFVISWPSCNKVERYQYLKSFPFKKRMPCFRNQLRMYYGRTGWFEGGVYTGRDNRDKGNKCIRGLIHE